VIRGMHHQHKDSPLRLTWDLEIVVVDKTTTNIGGIASFHSPYFTSGVCRIGCLEEWYSEESTMFQQLMIAWLTRGSQAYSYDGTVQISTMSGGFFTSYRIVWDPRDFITYEQV
jgi:hypothetical protein